MIERDELLDQFLIEGRELLLRTHEELTALGRGGGGAELEGLFRTVHTLKGSVGLFDLPELGALLHAVESALEVDRRADGVAQATIEATTRAMDVVEAWLDLLDQGGEPGEALLRRTRAAGAAPTQAESEAPPAVPPATPDWAVALVRPLDLATPAVAIRYRPSADAYFRGDDPLAIVQAVPGLVHLKLDAPAAAPDYDPFQCTLTVEAVATASLDEVRAAFRLVADQVELAGVPPAAGEAPARTELGLRTFRVDARRLDDLAALVDELVIAKNGLLQGAANDQGRSRGDADARAALERVVADLHAAVTDLRLAPLGQIFARFPRQVREIAEELGKTVDFAVEGDGVALDKGMVEALFEPLLHLIRNAIDHGIEPPEVRRTLGKPARATLRLRAAALGREVVIAVEDDGAGVDVAKIRATAADRGVVDADMAAALSDEAALMLIFAPGFSTADEVSRLSGRGVGMDAVRSAVSRIGGRIALDNRPGQGLAVSLTLPARVMLTRVLVVEVGENRYGVPLDVVSETHRVRREEVTAIRAGRAFVRRDTVIPLLRLDDLLGGRAEPDPVSFPVLNVEIDGAPVGIQIGEVRERIEAPLRPIAGALANHPGVLGAMQRGDGEVLLVLDLAGLAA